MQQRQRRVAEAALGLVVDAFEGEIVVRLGYAAQVGERVADFGALVEARAADHFVRQAHGDETLLELAHLERGAHEDRHIVERDPVPLRLFDRVADHARFLLAVPDAGDGRPFAHRRVGEQGLAEAALVMGDQPRGDRQDMAARAVVALEADDLRAGKVRLEPQDVVDVGAAPAVDRLVVVADTAEIAAGLRQQPEPQILDGVGVLILVDQDVAEPALEAGEHVGMLAE